MSTLAIQNLPGDISVEAARYLQTEDVLSLGLVWSLDAPQLSSHILNSQTCGSLREACKAKTVWLSILPRDVYSQYPPTSPYCRRFDALSGTECQALATHATRLHKTPRNTKSRMLKPIPLHEMKSVTWMRFIQGRWPLVASSDRTTPTPNGNLPPPEGFLTAPVGVGRLW